MGYERNERTTAYHEACHAVAADALGVKLLKATILPDASKNRAGAVTMSIPASVSGHDSNVINVAGLFGEVIFVGNPVEDLCLDGFGGDLRNVAAELGIDADAEAHQPAILDAMKRAGKRAIALLVKNAGAVHRVADALLRLKTLDAGELRKLIDGEPIDYLPARGRRTCSV